MTVTIDCMACLVNLARGLDKDPFVSIETLPIVHRDITHAAVCEMVGGFVRAACHYEKVHLYGNRWDWFVRR